jgi:hypothetical protein
MIRLLILATFFLIGGKLFALAQQYGIDVTTPAGFAAVTCTILIALVGIAKLLTKTE